VGVAKGFPVFPYRGVVVPTVVAVVLVGLTGAPACAHPHVWVDTTVTALVKDGKVVALRQDWSFDEDFTATVLADVRKIGGMAAVAQAKPFTLGEMAKLKQDAFSNLKNYNYFTHVWSGAKAVALGKEVSGFSARLEGERLAYTFTLPLAVPVDVKAGPVAIGVWDDSYYVDVGPAKGAPGGVEGDGSAACRSRVVESKEHAIYNGTIYPKMVEITC
jgi:ABC-type uncharacterized transport system substrate-binding protein